MQKPLAEHEPELEERVTSPSEHVQEHPWPALAPLLPARVARADEATPLSLAVGPVQTHWDAHLAQEVVGWPLLLEELELGHEVLQQLLAERRFLPAELVPRHLQEPDPPVTERVVVRSVGPQSVLACQRQHGQVTVIRHERL